MFLLLMAEILHQFIGSLSHYLQGELYIPSGCLGFLPSTVCWIVLLPGNGFHHFPTISWLSEFSLNPCHLTSCPKSPRRAVAARCDLQTEWRSRAWGPLRGGWLGSWWLKSGVYQLREVGSLTTIIYRVNHTSQVGGCCLGFLNHQQYVAFGDVQLVMFPGFNHAIHPPLNHHLGISFIFVHPPNKQI